MERRSIRGTKDEGRRTDDWALVVLAALAIAIVMQGCGSSSPSHTGAAAKAGGSASKAPSAASVRAPVIPPHFVDITNAAGIHFTNQNSPTPRKYLVETLGAGCAFIDYDGDGWQDILLLNDMQIPGGHVTGHPTMALYHNNHNGTFRDVTHAAGLDRESMYAMGVAVGDYDNDGRDDFYVSCVLGPGHLFHNEGNGKFKDVTAQAGVGNNQRWGTSCAWVDYDRDGKLDLFICNYVQYRNLKDDLPCYAGTRNYPMYCIPTAYDPSVCTFYHNDGGGHFHDVSKSSGIGSAHGKSLGVSIWDYDGDGWPDIFVANDTVPGFLFHNERNGTFKEVGVEAGVAYDDTGGAHSGMGIDTGDTMNNGTTSLAIANYYGVQTAFYVQAAKDLFREDQQPSGIGPPTMKYLGFGLAFFDYDNDGYQDLMQVNGHVQDDIEQREPETKYREHPLLFHNNADGTFEEVGLKSGAPFTDRIVGRGLAYGDIDNDGRLDVLITANGGPALLWRNETPKTGHWMTLKLVGAKSNRDGIGAMITVTAPGLKERRMVRSGSSYLSQSDLRAHFGLGAQRSAVVTVAWPSGAIDRITNLPCDKVSVIREGCFPVHPGTAGRGLGRVS